MRIRTAALVAALATWGMAAGSAPAQSIDLHVIQDSLTLHKGDITRAEAVLDNGMWTVRIDLAEPAARKFAEITARGVRKPMQIVVENRILSAPIVMTPITGGQIVLSGNFTEADARALAEKFK